MARLNDESHSIPGGRRHPSDQILSPQPCAPPSKEHLLASFETSHLHDTDTDTDTVTDDGQMPRDYEYPSSSSSTRHSSSDIFGPDMDDELDQMKSRASSRSSFSSVPASVLVHPLEKINSMRSMDPHEKMAAYTIEDDEARFGGFDGPPTNIRTIRQREAAFRKPSSVRAMQMHTEDEADDDEYLTPPRRRAGIRSPGSLPLKRSPYYSPTASANKPKPKKEYPLVLLHCNLLAPTLPVTGASEPQNQGIVEETLPLEYWKRWRRLQEKVGSGVLRDRGVLISHPEDLYDMLEERLLESLELQRSRLHQGHFIGHEESGPGSEGECSDQEESETDGEQGEECPDCGGRVQKHSDSNRKWEIRVYAANGLMRAGAWAAAWKEMEKVDVEVGLWLPSDLRRALEKRLLEEQAVLKEDFGPGPTIDAARGDYDPRRQSIQSHSRAESDLRSVQASSPSRPMPVNLESDIPGSQPQGKQVEEPRQETKEPQIALQTLLFNYFRVLASDRRNIALVIMSVLVVFLAIGARPQQIQQILHPFPQEIFEFNTTPSIKVNAPPISATSPNPPAESIISSTPDASLLVPESIVSSEEAALSSYTEVHPASPLVETKTTSVMYEPVASEFVTPPAEATSPYIIEEDLPSASTSEAEKLSINAESRLSHESKAAASAAAEDFPSSFTSSTEAKSTIPEPAAPSMAPESAKLESPELQVESQIEVPADSQQAQGEQLLA